MKTPRRAAVAWVGGAGVSGLSRFSAPRAWLLAGVLFAGLACAGVSPASAQDAAGEDDMFGKAEEVTQAAGSSGEAEGKSEFLKYDQVKVGGSITGKVGYNSIWSPAWDGSAEPFKPEENYLSPDLEGKLTIVAKPTTDFGVNMDFRTSWPFQTSTSVGSGYTDNPSTPEVDESRTSVSTPNITVWSLYSKFNWQDKVYFSFGKQPLAWGVSRGYFQPADDIFALSPTIDPTDTGAEREGPVSLKTTIPVGATKNLYLIASLPSSSEDPSKIDPADAHLAAKGEFGFGDTEAALAAYYSYNDDPRLLAMASTGLGNWNLYWEAIVKLGSDRYFVREDSSVPLIGLSGAKDPKAYFEGTLGGYYTDADADLTAAAAYLFNGEAQRHADASEVYRYYLADPERADAIRLGMHYAFASITKSNLFHEGLGSDKLAATFIAISNLSDGSGILMPSLTWSFFDYMSLKAGVSVNYGEAGDEFVFDGLGEGYGATKSGIAFNLLFTVGTGSF